MDSEDKINYAEILTPGGLPILKEAERHSTIPRKKGQLLSVACGYGELEFYLAERYKCKVFGIDADPNSIDVCLRKAAKRKLAGKTKFFVADAKSIPFRQDTFDMVLCCGGLSIFYDAGIKEFYRVLAPGGQLIIIDTVWRSDQIPPEVVSLWSEKGNFFRTLKGNCKIFQNCGFEMRYCRDHYRPDWWEEYFQFRKLMDDLPDLRRERNHYLAFQDFIGLGLFVLKKSDRT